MVAMLHGKTHGVQSGINLGFSLGWGGEGGGGSWTVLISLREKFFYSLVGYYYGRVLGGKFIGLASFPCTPPWINPCQSTLMDIAFGVSACLSPNSNCYPWILVCANDLETDNSY